MIATRRFFEMARQKARRIVIHIRKPFNDVISKKRPSLSGCVLTGIRVVAALVGMSNYLTRAASSVCSARTATQSYKILVNSV